MKFIFNNTIFIQAGCDADGGGGGVCYSSGVRMMYDLNQIPLHRDHREKRGQETGQFGSSSSKL